MNHINKKFLFPLILSIFFLLIFILFLHPITGDGDFFHDLNTGKYVIEHRSIPHVDEYTFTSHGRPWIANAWGTGVVYYLLYKISSTAVSVFTALIAVLLFALIYLWLRTYNISHKIILIAIAFSAPIIAIRFSSRPEVFTYPFLLACLLIDSFHSEKSKLLFLLPILFFFWSILYIGSVFVGLGLLCLLFVWSLIKNHFALNKHIAVYASFIVLSFIATLSNGNGLNGLLYITKIPAIARTSGEWLGIIQLLQQVQTVPLLLLQYRALLYFLYLFVFFSLVLFCIFIKRDIFKKYLFLSLISVAVFSPFFAIRNIPISLILSLPFFALMLAETEKKFKWLILIVMIPFIFLSILISIWINPIGVGQDTQEFSPEIIEFLANHNITGNVFTDQQVSPFLTFNLYPKVLVYSDTRDDLYLGTNILSTSNDIFYYGGDLEPLLKRYNVTAIVGNIDSGSSIDNLLYSPNWKLVFVNNGYYIFVRNTKANSRFRAYTGIDLASNTGTKSGKEKEALNEYRKLLGNYPAAFNIQLAAAQLYYSINDPISTISLAEKIYTPSGPMGPVFRFKRDLLLALSYLRINQCNNAKQSLDNLYDDTHGKFIFERSRTLPSNIEEYYMYYYLTCEKNIEEARSHLQKFLLDPIITPNEKQHAQAIFSHFSNINQN